MAELLFPQPSDPSTNLATDFGDVLRQAIDEGKLDEAEVPVTREVGMQLLLNGARTFGDALDQLENAGPAGRREMLDAARTAVGMDSIEDEEFAARRELRERALSDGPGFWSDAAGRRITRCAAKDCGVFPTTPSGALRPVADRVWWCPRHADQAGPHDHLPPEPEWVIGPNFALKPVGRKKEQLEAEERQRRELWERRQEQKVREGEALEAARERYLDNTTFNVLGRRVDRHGKILDG